MQDQAFDPEMHLNSSFCTSEVNVLTSTPPGLCNNINLGEAEVAANINLTAYKENSLARCMFQTLISDVAVL